MEEENEEVIIEELNKYKKETTIIILLTTLVAPSIIILSLVLYRIFAIPDIIIINIFTILFIIFIILLILGLIKMKINDYKYTNKEKQILTSYLIDCLKIHNKEELVDEEEECILYETAGNLFSYQQYIEIPYIRFSEEDIEYVAKFKRKNKNISIFSYVDCVIEYKYCREYKYYMTIIDVDTNKKLYLETKPRGYITNNKCTNNNFEKAYINKIKQIRKFDTEYDNEYNRYPKEKQIEINENEYIQLSEEDKELFMDIYNKYNLFFKIIFKNKKLILINRIKMTSENIQYKKNHIKEITNFIEEMIEKLDIYFSKKEF